MPSVSLVIPVYNAENYLDECLESVLAQTFEDMEIICVDDGSTDASAQILSAFAGRDDRVRIFTQPNAGVASARGRGLELATGDFVLFLDNDDFFEPSMVEEAYRACVTDDADIAVFKIRYVDAESGDSVDADWSLRTDLIPDSLPFNRLDMPRTLFLAFTPSIWNKMFRRSFLTANAIRLRTDLRYTDDLAFTYVALALAGRITIVDKVLLSYRTKRDGSLWTRASDHPDDVCTSLLGIKDQLVSAGVFHEVEPAFANAALHQCLWVLSNLRTLPAFSELYVLLKTSCFAELGIGLLSEDSSLRPSEYQRYRRIMDSSQDQYLFDEIALLAAQLEQRRAQHARTSAEKARFQAEAQSLRAELKLTREKLRLESSQSSAAKAKLKLVTESRSYRLGRLLTSPGRALRRLVARDRNGA